MDSLCLSWRGNPGTGKRAQLLQHLQLVAKGRQLPFSLHTKFLQIGSATAGSTGEVDEADETTGERTTEAGQFSYESSVVHVGFDVSRMSMQDKNILRPVFLRLGQGSQVLAGPQGHGSRILVLYHAHLLSTESILLLQAALEQNDGDLSVWMTSEIPSPVRVRDWFVEVPVKGGDSSARGRALSTNGAASGSTGDRQFELYKQKVFSDEHLADWPDVFVRLFSKWLKQWNGKPTLDDVPAIKSFVYGLLMRNLRWTECVHFVLDAVIMMPGLSTEQRQKALDVVAKCEGTGGGQTLPSYRIPILWESLFLQLRSAISL
jgi:hypothetical protein